MKKIRIIGVLAALVIFFAGCGGGGRDQINPVEPAGEPKITVTFVSNQNPSTTDLRISRQIMAGLPKELEGEIKFLRVFYDFDNGVRHGWVTYEFSDNVTADIVAVPFSTVVVSASLLSINETEVAQGILFKNFQTSWMMDVGTNTKKIENVPIHINLNEWINSSLAFFNLPGAWSLPTGGKPKWYRVEVVTDNHQGDFYQNIMDFCKFIMVRGKTALLLESVWLPFEPRCLQLDCPSVTVKPTIDITLTDDLGKEWKFSFEISNYLPFLESIPAALYYQ